MRRLSDRARDKLVSTKIQTNSHSRNDL